MAQLAAAVGLLAVGFSASADVVDIAWDGEGRFDKALSIAPGKFAEVCGKLSKGRAVAWTFKSTQPMDFNIHYHEGKEVRFPARQDQSLASRGVLDPASEQDYCWMWTNKTKGPADLVLVLSRR